MPLILDTMNVLHTVGVLPPDLAGLDVAGLARLIVQGRYGGERVTFVCDGLPPTTTRFGAVQTTTDLPPPGPLMLNGVDADRPQFFVRYAGRAATADDLIRNMVNASTAPRRVTVVSSDHAVQRDARKRKCIVLTAEEFLQHLADDARLPQRMPSDRAPRRPSSMSAEQVQRWMSVFNVDLEQAQAEVNAQLSHEESDDEPAPTDAPATASSPSTNSPANPPADRSSSVPRAPLPADLVAQAEALWQSGQRRSNTPKSDGISPPNAETRRATGNADSSPPANRPNDAPANEADLAGLDMNAILPADGRTVPLRKGAERHRPTNPPST